MLFPLLSCESSSTLIPTPSLTQLASERDESAVLERDEPECRTLFSGIVEVVSELELAAVEVTGTDILLELNGCEVLAVVSASKVEIMVSMVRRPCLILSIESELEFTWGRGDVDVVGLKGVGARDEEDGAPTDVLLGTTANREVD